MDERLKGLKGSPSRDRFKQLHKARLPSSCYALDADLVLIEKYPVPFIVAYLDFKTPKDSITFTEAIGYKDWTAGGTPVYLITGYNFEAEDTSTHRFNVELFIDADYRPSPPSTNLTLVEEQITWGELSKWEQMLRANRRQMKAARIKEMVTA